MIDSPDPHQSAEAREPADETCPWDEEPPPGQALVPGAPKTRHDAFTVARKAEFLRALVKTGCILDACRKTGISARTLYRHQESDADFAGNIGIALRAAAAPIELVAWRRAVEGVDQPFACGGEVHIRKRYSDGLLRLLLQGSNPRKYGVRPGFRRKQIRAFERKEIEREIRAEIAARTRLDTPSIEEVRDEVLRRIRAISDHRERQGGWSRTHDGSLLPPGYGWIGLPDDPDAPPPGPPADEAPDGSAEAGDTPDSATDGGDTPRDSV